MSAPHEEVSTSHRRCGECQRVFASRVGMADHFRMKHGRDPRVEDFHLAPKEAPAPRATKRDGYAWASEA